MQANLFSIFESNLQSTERLDKHVKIMPLDFEIDSFDCVHSG